MHGHVFVKINTSFDLKWLICVTFLLPITKIQEHKYLIKYTVYNSKQVWNFNESLFNIK